MAKEAIGSVQVKRSRTMLESGGGGDFSAAIVNAILLALWAVLPVLAAAYVRQYLLAPRRRPEFMLQKSERSELKRAVVLYAQVRRRLEQMLEGNELINGFWRAALRRQSDIPEQNEELEDLKAYAQHLQAMISRLRNQPLSRLNSWISTRSVQYALGYAIAVYCVCFVLLWLLAFDISDQPAWAQDFQTEFNDGLLWYPFDQRFFYVNAAAIMLSGVATPLIYFIRRYSLRRQCSLEFCVFADLADIGPTESIFETDIAFADNFVPANDDLENDEDWIRILGVSESATIQEVKHAYKTLIKQNHPDRVQGMSQAFKKLAEIETKKINAAYRQALSAASPA
jgi:ABC-type multidrug transport system fused ATPase/permease subunit